MNAASPVCRTSPVGGLIPRALRLAVCAAVVCLAGTAQGAVPDAVQVTRFQRTAQYLQEAPAELRSDFAAIALSGLARAYFAEAKLAREEAVRNGRSPQLVSWSARVERYASQMPLLLDDIEMGLPVSLNLGPDKSLAITVADRTVILSHPRLNEQHVFEQGILVSFCARHSCDDISPAPGGLAAIPVAAVKVRPQWSFTAQESVCAYDGIRVRFNNTRNMANARLICQQLIQEIVTLTDELAWQWRHTVAIEWGHLEVQPTPGRPGHMLQLNTLGDTVLVTVPMLYRSTALFEQVLPWVRQRVTQQAQVSIELDADRYGWQKP